MCAPCKIILDGGMVIGASLRLYARRATKSGNQELADAALYLADITRGIAEAISFAVEHSDATKMRYEESFDEALERAHAWSELCCHRAKAIRADAQASKFTAAQIYEWAEGDRLLATNLFGGEYGGPDAKWQIVGLEGIERKKE